MKMRQILLTRRKNKEEAKKEREKVNQKIKI
jgi:hypothetical protein